MTKKYTWKPKSAHDDKKVHMMTKKYTGWPKSAHYWQEVHMTTKKCAWWPQIAHDDWEVHVMTKKCTRQLWSAHNNFKTYMHEWQLRSAHNDKKWRHNDQEEHMRTMMSWRAGSSTSFWNILGHWNVRWSKMSELERISWSTLNGSSEYCQIQAELLFRGEDFFMGCYFRHYNLHSGVGHLYKTERNSINPSQPLM